jgi:hypothetical protein
MGQEQIPDPPENFVLYRRQINQAFIDNITCSEFGCIDIVYIYCSNCSGTQNGVKCDLWKLVAIRSLLER